MQDQQLIGYIIKARASGQSEAEIKNALLGVGWQAADIDEAFPSSIIVKLPDAFSLLKEAFFIYKLQITIVPEYFISVIIGNGYF